jgi:uncharacterized protein YwgA
MTKYVEEIYDIQTGETTLRDLTKAEIDKLEKERSQHFAIIAATKAEAEAKAEARSVILDRLGLTDEEAKILLG